MEKCPPVKYFKNFLRTGSISANYSYMVLASLCRAFLSLFLMAILARYLGVEHFGIFSYALAFGELFVFLADFGQPTVFIRDAAASVHSDEAQIIYSNVLVAQLLSIAITYFLIITIASFLTTSENSALIRLLALAVMLGGLSRMAAGAFRIFDRMQYEAFTVAGERFLTLILVAAVAFLKGNIHDIALAWVAGSLGGYLLNLGLIHRNFLRFRLRTVTIPRVLRSLREGAPLALASFFTALKSRAGVIILQALAGSVALGLFSAGYRLLALPYAFATSFQSTIISTFSRLSEDSSGSLQEVYKASLRLALVMGFVCQALVMFMAPWAIPLLFGEGFRNSIFIVQVLSLTIIPIFGYLVTNSLLVARKQNKHLLLAWLAVGIINVVASSLLCPFLGAQGLAWSLVISEFGLFLINYLYIKATFGSGELLLQVTKNCGAVSVSFLMYLVFIYVDIGQMVASIFAGFAYLAILTALRVITLKEVVYFTSINTNYQTTIK